MTRDELAGLALHGPEGARTDVPGAGDAGDGEDEAVHTMMVDGAEVDAASVDPAPVDTASERFDDARSPVGSKQNDTTQGDTTQAGTTEAGTTEAGTTPAGAITTGSEVADEAPETEATADLDTAADSAADVPADLGPAADGEPAPDADAPSDTEPAADNAPTADTELGADVDAAPAAEAESGSDIVSTVDDPAVAEPAPDRDTEPGSAEASESGAEAAPTSGADALPTPPVERLDATVASAAPAGGYEEVTTTYVVQDAAAELSPSDLRIDFGAHLEANYQRLVAQMYAITLSPDQAHSVVQDAYSRAWRNWSVIGRSADPTGWVRRVAVRTTMRSWRHVLARFGLVRSAPPVAEGLDERTTQLLTALRELPAPERRSVVLFHMVGLSHGEIAVVEQVSPNTISTRLDRARRGVMGDNSDLLTGVIELPGVVLDNDRGYVDEMSLPAEMRGQPAAGHMDDRWERADTWNGGPDGSWIVSEAPPWDAPNPDEWPRNARTDRSDAGGSQSGAGGGARDGGNDLPREADHSAWDATEGLPIDDGSATNTDLTPRGDAAGYDMPTSDDDKPAPDGSVNDDSGGSGSGDSYEDTPSNDSEDRR